MLSCNQDQVHIVEYSYPGMKNNKVILESNLHDGPTFFNCYPKFSMNIRNDKTSNSIKLYVQTLEDIVDELSGPIHITYRIYYKIKKIDYNYKALRSLPKDETILVEANLRKSSVL